MRKVYYNLMRNSALALPFLLISSLGANPAAAQSQAPLKTASLESHEGMTVSAQPWTDAAQYKEKFPGKKSPFSAGILAIQVSFRNDSDEPMKVSLARLRLDLLLSDNNRQSLQPLTPEDLADRVLNPGPKDPSKSRPRLPIPIGKSGGGRDKHWTELQREAAEAAIPASIVEPHKAVHGLLYFDLQGQFDLLDAAHLYVPNVTTLGSNRALTYFEISLGHQASR